MSSTGPLFLMFCVYPLLCFALPAVFITLFTTGYWKWQSPIRRGERPKSQSAVSAAKAAQTPRRDVSGFGSG